jgi:integrase
MDALIAAARGSQHYVPIMLALTTGLRRGEVCGLKWEDVDLEKGTLAVRRSLEQIGKHVIEKDPKTAGSRRLVLLPKLAVDVLAENSSIQAANKQAMGEAYQDGGWVCAHADGRHLQPDSVTSNYRKVLAKAGLPHCRFHDLRHTLATQLLANGVPVKVVSEILGHSSVYITQDVYSHVLPHMQQQAADTIDRLFGTGAPAVKEVHLELLGDAQ